jgi:hypothetical protein
MRNLTLSSTTLTAFQNTHISATAIDVDENVIYATSEKLSPDGELEVEIWKVDKDGVSAHKSLWNDTNKRVDTRRVHYVYGCRFFKFWIIPSFASLVSSSPSRDKTSLSHHAQWGYYYDLT